MMPSENSYTTNAKSLWNFLVLKMMNADLPLVSFPQVGMSKSLFPNDATSRPELGTVFFSLLALQEKLWEQTKQSQHTGRGGSSQRAAHCGKVMPWETQLPPVQAMTCILPGHLALPSLLGRAGQPAEQTQALIFAVATCLYKLLFNWG